MRATGKENFSSSGVNARNYDHFWSGGGYRERTGLKEKPIQSKAVERSEEILCTPGSSCVFVIFKFETMNPYFFKASLNWISVTCSQKSLTSNTYIVLTMCQSC